MWNYSRVVATKADVHMNDELELIFEKPLHYRVGVSEWCVVAVAHSRTRARTLRRYQRVVLKNDKVDWKFSSVHHLSNWVRRIGVHSSVNSPGPHCLQRRSDAEVHH